MDRCIRYLCIISGVCFFLFSCEGKNENVYQEILRPVRLADVASIATLNKIYTGVVVAEEYADLAFKIPGPLVEMNVEAGQSVKKGAVIAVIDPLDFQSKYEAAKAAWITARSQLDRDRRLLAMQAIAVQEYEIAEANYARAQSTYLSARNTLRDTRLTAPFDGFIAHKYVENYQKVQTGEPIVKLINPDKLAVSFVLPETSVNLLKDSLRLAVEFDTYPGRWYTAKVKKFVDASPEGGGIPVKMVIDDTLFRKEQPDVYPGFSARVRVQIGNTVPDSYMVPLRALFENPYTNFVSVWVYMPSTQTVRSQQVNMVQLYGTDRMLVSRGLEPEDLIVIDGVNFITEGQQVRVLGNVIE